MLTKLRAKMVGEVTRVSALINHPMTSGLIKPGEDRRKDHCRYITEVVAEHEGNRVMLANWSGTVARNPFLSFRFKGGTKGDSIHLRWIDTDGIQGSATTRIA